MILVFSTQDWELSTEEVMDWIRALGGRCLRYNGEDLAGPETYCLRVGADATGARLTVGDLEVRVDDVQAVWYRRGARLDLFTIGSAFGEAAHAEQFDTHLKLELRETAHGLYSLLAGRPWLTRPSQVRVNKFTALQAAARAGLQIPATIVTNSRAELEGFLRQHGRIITKAISDGTAFKLSDRRFTLYTEEVGEEEVAALPENFLPTLGQELLEKAYELRVFYLAGACYAMAIFSQSDAQTAVDFRRYNMERPNRTVPYRLDPTTEAGIRSLMSDLDLVTGSLDLVRTTDGRVVFLEVNPVGQFGMVSAPCNYYLEKAVARHLLSLGKDERPILDAAN